jgi:soluble lytic murein transglycosylase-like protein
MRRLTIRQLTLSLVLTMGMMANGPTAAVEVYRFVDSQGRVHLTDRPPHDGYRLLQKDGRKLNRQRVNFRDKEANRKRFSPKISQVARQYRVPEALLHAVIATESAYDPNAVSRAGAVGLMQLMPATARRYGVRDRRNPGANLAGGTRYLKDLLTQFESNLELALAGYNAGENAVEKYGNQVPPFPETQNYVRKVLKLYRQNASESSGGA